MCENYKGVMVNLRDNNESLEEVGEGEPNSMKDKCALCSFPSFFSISLFVGIVVGQEAKRLF